MLSFENDYSEGAHEKILQRFMETNLEKVQNRKSGRRANVHRQMFIS